MQLRDALDAGGPVSSAASLTVPVALTASGTVPRPRLVAGAFYNYQAWKMS